MISAYICHPLATPSQVENVHKVRDIVKNIIERYQEAVVPIAVHNAFYKTMFEETPGHRELGLKYDLYLLKSVDELWVFGNKISSGMALEIEYCLEIKKPIVIKSPVLDEFIRKVYFNGKTENPQAYINLYLNRNRPDLVRFEPEYLEGDLNSGL